MPKISEVTFKVVVSDPKTGLAFQVELKGEDAKRLLGKKIGDIIPGEWVGMNGYKLEITGGSDFAGFPMRKEIEGTGKKRIWWWVDKRTRVKKLVRGNTISEEIVQINTKVIEYGPTPFEEYYKKWKEQKKSEE